MKSIFDLLKEKKVNFFHSKRDFEETFFISLNEEIHNLELILNEYEKEIKNFFNVEKKTLKDFYKSLSTCEICVVDVLDTALQIYENNKDIQEYCITFNYEYADFTESCKFSYYEYGMKNDCKIDKILNNLDAAIDYSNDAIDIVYKLQSILANHLDALSYDEKEENRGSYLFNQRINADNLTGFFIQSTDL